MSPNKRRNKRRKQSWLVQAKKDKRKTVFLLMAGVAIVVSIGIIAICNFIIGRFLEDREEANIDYSVYWAKEEADMTVDMPEIDVQLLTINEYSRPAIATERIQNIVIHYTANPESTAQQNRDYFEGLKDSQSTKASSKFIVGIDGEIIQCVPTNEIAYASNHANSYSVSIEICHMDATGEFTDATYQSVIELCAYLCDKFDLEAEDVIRHYDVTGKMCPLYYVENEDAYEQLHKDIEKLLK